MAYEIRVFVPGWKLLLPTGAVPSACAQQAFEAYENLNAFDAIELCTWPCGTQRHFDPVSQCGQAVGGPVAIREAVFHAVGGLCHSLPDEAAMMDFLPGFVLQGIGWVIVRLPK